MVSCSVYDSCFDIPQLTFTLSRRSLFSSSCTLRQTTFPSYSPYFLFVVSDCAHLPFRLVQVSRCGWFLSLTLGPLCYFALETRGILQVALESSMPFANAYTPTFVSSILIHSVSICRMHSTEEKSRLRRFPTTQATASAYQTLEYNSRRTGFSSRAKVKLKIWRGLEGM